MNGLPAGPSRPKDTMPGRTDPVAKDDLTETWSLVLLPRFSLLSVACIVEPLRAANRLAGKRLFDWRTLSTDGAAMVEASNGFRIAADGPIGVGHKPGTVVICSGIDGHLHDEPGLTAWLRELNRAGVRVGAVTTGTWLLARAGLLDARRCTIHWEDEPAFREAFPRVALTPDLFVVEGRHFTCSGGTAILDLMLHFVRERGGELLGREVADQLILDRLRPAEHEQRAGAPENLMGPATEVARAIQIMERDRGAPTSVETIAASVGLSLRQLERQFRSALGITPKVHQNRLRNRRVRDLLRQTSLSVIEIAVACGFSSTSHLARSYRKHFGVSPKEERKRARHGAPAPAVPVQGGKAERPADS